MFAFRVSSTPSDSSRRGDERGQETPRGSSRSGEDMQRRGKKKTDGDALKVAVLKCRDVISLEEVCHSAETNNIESLNFLKQV